MEGKNIILCGSDAVFKTTVANLLSKELGYPIVKGSDFESATKPQNQLFNFFMSKIKGEPKIIDRFIYSNLVYTELFPEYTRISNEQKNYIEGKMSANSIVVYLTASPETIISRLEERGDEYIEGKDIASILEIYEKVMFNAKKNGVQVLEFDTDYYSSKDIVKELVNK